MPLPVAGLAAREIMLQPMTGLDRAALLEAAAYVDRWIAFRLEQRDLPGLVVAIRHAMSSSYARAMAAPNSIRRSQ